MFPKEDAYRELGYKRNAISKAMIMTCKEELTFAMYVNEFGEISGSQYVAFEPNASIQTYFIGIRPAVWVKKGEKYGL